MRRMVRKDNSRRKKILSIGLVLFAFMGIGYSVISTNLMFNGNIELSKYESPYLYDVLKFEALRGGLAQKYTGEHHDSFTEEPSKDIYHWYADNDTDGTAIQNKNNVIFADHCWQMIRTTDTGGVKIIYNGEAENGQCLNTRGNHVGYKARTSETLNSNYWYGTDYTYDSTNKVFSLSGTTEQVTWSATTGRGLIGNYTCKSLSESDTCSTLYLVESYNNASSGYVIPLDSNSNYSQFGNLQFNSNYDSPTYAGYMYGDIYAYGYIDRTVTQHFTNTQIISGSIVLGDTITDNGDDSYTINNITTVTLSDWTTNYESYKNLYTCGNISSTCSNPRYITTTTSSNYKYINLIEKIMIGKTRNGLTLTDTILVSEYELVINSSNYSEYKYTCNSDNADCSESTLRLITGYFSTGYYYVPNRYYASSVTWDGTNYTLVDTIEIENYNNLDNISTHHYTCVNNGEKVCSIVGYIYYYSDGSDRMYYIPLKNGVITVSKAMEDMFTKNERNSTIKNGVDYWYKHYLLEDYDEYVEDSIFCNDRSIRFLGGWNPNGGMINTFLRFKEYNLTTDLNCISITDQFSVSNNNAKLTYKVGLLSSPEINIINNSIVRKTGINYWLASPNLFSFSTGTPYALGNSVRTDGAIIGYNVSRVFGVRPVISLKPGTEFIYGTGTKEDPYVVKTKKECTYNGELTQGAEFVDGQYTYRYMQEYGLSSWENIDDDGWGVKLTDSSSTDSVNTKICTTINNKPIVSMQSMFLSSMASSIDLSSFDTSNVVNMNGMFAGSKATSLDLRGFDTSNVTNMGNMFASASSTSLNLSSFNTNKVTNMEEMFYKCVAPTLDLSNFDTRKVTDMNGMFSFSNSTSIDVSSFDTRNVTDMRNMFNNSKVNSLNISSFNNSNVTDSEGMLCNVSQDIITTGDNFTFKDEMFSCSLA